ncbi:conserved hypothetical protein [Ignisphaera aggregans DSM 17230]|uniref:Uncharacterized protein n=1 Tax=Ignisphaera aggregans (strain DSM 17230 / JCM 13409 / AQ1.S1) TaxID=583356 RepID=E0SRD8_IGNAA|nr:conserved hypothetical protein [Ignisphaera aggregans DSM 17230]
MSEYEKALMNIPRDALQEIEEYEEQNIERRRRSQKKRKFPSYADIIEAIKEISGGSINRYTIDELYEAVLKYLEEQGFDTSMITENKFWRIVTSLVNRGSLRAELE